MSGKTLVLSTRISPQTIAKLAIWAETNLPPAKSKSDLIASCLRYLAEQVGGPEMSEEAALMALSKLGYGRDRAESRKPLEPDDPGQGTVVDSNELEEAMRLMEEQSDENHG